MYFECRHWCSGFVQFEILPPLRLRFTFTVFFPESEYQETKDALTREQENLTNKLGSMKEYEIQRAELMAKFAKIEEELTRQQQEHQQVIYDLERQMVVDKDRLRKEAAEKVTNLATEFRKVSDKQMEDTKKKALRENVQLNKNLQRSVMV